MLNTNHTPRDEIVAYLYQNKRDGTYLEVIDAEGESIRKWHETKANRYSVSSWSAPEPSMVAVLDGVITERNAKGEVLRQYTVPDLGSYKHATTGVLDGDLRAILVRNGGCPSRLLVFDATETLVYDEVFDAYATLHVPAAGPASSSWLTGPTLPATRGARARGAARRERDAACDLVATGGSGHMADGQASSVGASSETGVRLRNPVRGYGAQAESPRTRVHVPLGRGRSPPHNSVACCPTGGGHQRHGAGPSTSPPIEPTCSPLR